MYEGRSINKLQNGAISLVLKTGKVGNIRSIVNLTLSTRCDFYYDDVNPVMLPLKSPCNEQCVVIVFFVGPKT